MQLNSPSTKIDAAICDLIVRLNHFSDEHFDAGSMHLNDDEIEELSVRLLQHFTQHLDGRLLAGLLLVIREQAALLAQPAHPAP